MKTQKILTILLISLFVLTGCGASSQPEVQLNVYKGSCHIIGNDVYFAYNGVSYTAKNQVAGFNTQSKQAGVDISVILMRDGSFIIPAK